MKYQIRRNIFETNSSSVHVLAIGKKDFVDLPSRVRFSLGKFGWDRGFYSDFSSLASYLYTAICCFCKEMNVEVDIDKIKEIIEKTLNSNGIDAEFEDYKSNHSFYIDHVEDLEKFLKMILSSEELFMHFLFSDDSFVETGNDNRFEEDYPDITKYDKDKYLYLDYK